MNGCTKFCANPSIKRWDISQDKWKFDLSVVLNNKRLDSLFRMYPLGTMNFCTKICGNSSHSFWDISLKKQECQSHGGMTGEVRGSASCRSNSWWDISMWTKVVNQLTHWPTLPKIHVSCDRKLLTWTQCQIEEWTEMALWLWGYWVSAILHFLTLCELSCVVVKFSSCVCFPLDGIKIMMTVKSCLDVELMQHLSAHLSPAFSSDSSL